MIQLSVRAAPLRAVTLAAIAVIGAGAALAASTDGKLSPQLAGAHYGQALGALEICYGSQLTDKAKTLAESYAGADGETFKSSAAKTFQAWTEVKNCVNQKNPNVCKVAMDRSCLAAEAEIGESGSAVPGLVAFAKRPPAPAP